MRSSLVVRASDCQCTSCNCPGFDPSIRRHSGIWEAADEAVLNTVQYGIELSLFKYLQFISFYALSGKMKTNVVILRSPTGFLKIVEIVSLQSRSSHIFCNSRANIEKYDFWQTFMHCIFVMVFLCTLNLLQFFYGQLLCYRTTELLITIRTDELENLP